MKELEIDLESIRNRYQDAYEKHGDSVKSLLWSNEEKGLLRYESLTRFIPRSTPFSLLDYGCGFGGLETHLMQKFPQYHYCGVDIVEEFIISNTKKLHERKLMPNTSVEYEQIKDHSSIYKSYDYIAIAGVFNIFFDKTFSIEHQVEYVLTVLEKLWAHTNIALSVNLMSDLVDYKLNDVFYSNPGEMYRLLAKRLSRRCVLDLTYLPFEYTITCYKDAELAGSNASDYARSI